MKIAILDTVYPDFLVSVPFDENSTYEQELRKVLDLEFGTSDFYSRALAALGWDCIDVIVNHDRMQEMWARENGNPADVIEAQIEAFKPDVIFLQDVGYFPESKLKKLKSGAVLAAQISCPMPPVENVRLLDCVMTSFPHYVQRFEALKVKAVYVPLAFEPSVLAGPQPERDIDISFVGGAGRESHWRQGTDTLEIVAETFRERFRFYGYGVDRLQASSALRACYRGEAWGRKMYDIYRRSKIVINRHGEVAEGYANNLRMFEATGCGACLFTEDSTNLGELFSRGKRDGSMQEVIPYRSASEAVERIGRSLEVWPSLEADIASAGRSRTLRDHTYAHRMQVVSSVLQEMLCRV